MVTILPAYLEAFARGYAACRRGESPEVPPTEAYKEQWLKGYVKASLDGEFDALNRE